MNPFKNTTGSSLINTAGIVLLILGACAPKQFDTRAKQSLVLIETRTVNDIDSLIDNALARIASHEAIHLIIVKDTGSYEKIIGDFDLILCKVGDRFSFSGAIQPDRVKSISEMKYDRFDRIKFSIKPKSQNSSYIIPSVLEIIYTRPHSNFL